MARVRSRSPPSHVALHDPQEPQKLTIHETETVGVDVGTSVGSKEGPGLVGRDVGKNVGDGVEQGVGM